jgi:BirA family biotin operon repressor/biotin-[acetyl-CoA-carboxylase] ligase
MDIAWELVKEDRFPEYAWILAGSQTRGRGRLNREWISGEGNLMISMRLPVNAGNLGNLLSPALALPLVQSLNETGVAARIKWPNDIMAGDVKVGGILIEQRNEIIVAGIGINLVTAPQTSREENFFQIKAGCLQAYGVNLEPASLWTLFLKNIKSQLPALIANPLKVAEKVEAVLAFKEEPVVLQNTGRCDGPAVILGVDVCGNLRVRTSGGVYSISAGSIFLPVV